MQESGAAGSLRTARPSSPDMWDSGHVASWPSYLHHVWLSSSGQGSCHHQLPTQPSWRKEPPQPDAQR